MVRILSSLLAASAFVATAPAISQSDAEQLTPALPAIPSLRDQARIQDQWTAERLDTIVPALMREQGIDM